MNPGKGVDAPALVAPTSFEANKEIYVSRDALAEAEKAPPARVISDAEFSERYAAAFGVARRLERGVGGNNDRLASTVNNLPEPKSGAQPLASEFVDEFANPYTRAVVQFDRAGGSAALDKVNDAYMEALRRNEVETRDAAAHLRAQLRTETKEYAKLLDEIVLFNKRYASDRNALEDKTSSDAVAELEDLKVDGAATARMIDARISELPRSISRLRVAIAQTLMAGETRTRELRDDWVREQNDVLAAYVSSGVELASAQAEMLLLTRDLAAEDFNSVDVWSRNNAISVGTYEVP